jgi:hypothetical protein
MTIKSIILGLILIPVSGLAQLPSYAPTQNLEGFYSFSGNVLDNSGNGNNNANYNIISTTDRFNNLMRALYFSGTGNEYLNYGDVDSYEPYIGSFSFWILPEDFGANSPDQYKPIISKWGGPGDLAGSTYNIYLNGTDLCFLITDGITTDTLTASLSNISLNQWNHIVITSNYGFIKFYINNVLVLDTVSPISSFNFSDSEFKVGGWYQDINPSYSSFTGKIDDIGIWSRELDACEVDALYTANECLEANLEELHQYQKELVRIVDLMGKETSFRPNTTLIYLFSDGSIERKFVLE